MMTRMTMFLAAAGAQRKTAAPAPPANQPDADGWQSVQTERPQWKPGDQGMSDSIQGFLISRINDLPLPKPKTLPNGEVVTTWAAFVVELTAPAKCSAPFGEAIIDVPAGTEVLVGESAKLSDLRRFLVPQALIEVRIKDLGKVDLGGGKTLRRFDVAANKKTVKARPRHVGMGQLSRAPEPAALPPASAPAEDDGLGFIPF